MDKKNMLIAGVAALLATVATVIVVRAMRDDEEKPPRKAPQLPIQNPGEQSEFTTSASESEVG